MADLPQHPPFEANAVSRVLLTESEAAAAIGFTPRFMQERRFKGGGPPFVRVSARAVRYRPVDLEAWAEARVRSSTSDPGPDAAP